MKYVRKRRQCLTKDHLYKQLTYWSFQWRLESMLFNIRILCRTLRKDDSEQGATNFMHGSIHGINPIFALWYFH